MAKKERTPLARTEMSAEMLEQVAHALNIEIVGEIRRLCDKMRTKGIPDVAVTGMKSVEKARKLLIGWIAATETNINKATRPINEIAKETAEKIAAEITEKEAKRKGKK